jgi:hypothetical protein
MASETKKPILVSGSPRSGTTWVGRLMDRTPLTHYVHEPFNIGAQHCNCGTRFDTWFFYLTPENLPAYREHLRHTIFPAFNRTGLLNAVAEFRRKKRYVHLEIIFRLISLKNLS